MGISRSFRGPNYNQQTDQQTEYRLSLLKNSDKITEEYKKTIKTRQTREKFIEPKTEQKQKSTIFDDMTRIEHEHKAAEKAIEARIEQMNIQINGTKEVREVKEKNIQNTLKPFEA